MSEESFLVSGQAPARRRAHPVPSRASRALLPRHRSRGPVVGRAVVGGVRDRRDPARADDRRRRGARPRHADRRGHRGHARRSSCSRTGRPSMPIPSGGGAYIVAKENLGRAAEPGGRGLAAHRLRAHRGGQHRRRRRRDHLGAARVAAQPRRAVARVRRDADARQPARHPRIGPALRGADLFLHRQHPRR